MRYLSVCSGIEAATVAWHPLGWKPAAFSEIEPFPRRVLKHHYPEVPLHGDFTTIQGREYGAIDLLVGGTPCQSFSVAGLRAGLDDERGNLALEFLKLAQRTRARWLVWENVPGVLSSNGGRDFGSILGGLVELGYGVSWRVLDAQYFGVPQRRRRVFVVGYLGDWRRPAAVLFERHSLQGNPPPSRKAGEAVAPTVTSGSANGGAANGARSGSAKEGLIVPALAFGGNNTSGPIDVSTSCLSHGGPTGRLDFSSETFVVPTYRWQNENDGFVVHPVVFHPTQDPIWSDDGATHTMGTGNRNGCATVAVAFGGDIARTLSARHDSSPCVDRGMDVVTQGMAVRRLTPRECERLQGFPDDYTLLGERTPDGPRYKALGNSMAVPVMRWIGERIADVESR